MNWPEDLDAHRQNFATIVEWIAEAHGDEVAHTWAWECTPFPCWAPSIEQLEEGFMLAIGVVTIGELLEKTYAELERFAKSASLSNSDPQKESNG